MNMRGAWAERPDGAMVLNVTSCQKKDNKNRLAFSPMGQKEYRGFYNFEAYWQSGKRYEGVDAEKVVKWWKNIKTPKRRFPGKHKVVCAEWDGTEYDYVESRKCVYIPCYYNMVKDDEDAMEMVQYWQEQLENGRDVVIYDFDGPRNDGEVACEKVSKKLLRKKLKDTSSPFGHGYVVAMLIKGYRVKNLVNKA